MFKLFSISLKIIKPVIKYDNDSVLEIKKKPFNIFTINIIIYNYYFKNYKKKNTILFYITYENLIKTADNLLKNYAKIAKIKIICDNFIKKTTIPEEIIN